MQLDIRVEGCSTTSSRSSSHRSCRRSRSQRAASGHRSCSSTARRWVQPWASPWAWGSARWARWPARSPPSGSPTPRPRAASAACARRREDPELLALVERAGSPGPGDGRCSRRGSMASRSSGSSVMPAGSKRMFVYLRDEGRERHAVLETEADRDREGVHDPGQGRALLGDLDEHLTGAAVLVLADGDVALAVRHPEREGVRRRRRGSRSRTAPTTTASCCAAASRPRARRSALELGAASLPALVAARRPPSWWSRAAGRPCSCRGRWPPP